MFRRVRRILGSVILVLLMLVWLALVGLWVRSHWRGDQITGERHGLSGGNTQWTRQYLLLSGHGGVCLAIRDTQTSGAIVSSGNTPWQVTRDPGYPEPWAKAMAGTIVITGGTISLPTGGGVLNMGTGTTSLTGTGGTMTVGTGPTTGPAAASSSMELWVSGGSGSVTVGPSRYMINSGALSMPAPTTLHAGGSSGGSYTWRVKTSGTVSGVTINSGALSLSANTLVIQVPLPSPEKPPASPFQFFAYQAGSARDLYGRAHVVVFPYWSLVLVLSVPLGLAMRSEYRSRLYARRLRDGLCANCGYDLRATPERCPECGSIPNGIKLITSPRRN